MRVLGILEDWGWNNESGEAGGVDVLSFHRFVSIGASILPCPLGYSLWPVSAIALSLFSMDDSKRLLAGYYELQAWTVKKSALSIT